MTSNIDRRVLNALKEAKEKLAAVEAQSNESIAIIGMAGRFPGANNIDEYWHNLQQGINSIRFLSPAELQASGIEQDLSDNPNYVRAYSSFDGIEEFAAEFFGYSPLEAEVIDPQQRIFLESAWTALENAGYDSDRLEGRVGVFAGSALNTYLLNLNSASELSSKLNDVQVVIGNVMGLMPTRVSYKLNLKGVSCGIQTGCSTSLVAVHLACQSLLDGESDMALAGGITINAAGKQGYLYQEGSIASPDGYCRAFDAEGKGTVFGNGVGIVVLKRLSAAVRDRDRIWAVIKGSAVNNDGGDKVGLTAPSIAGQAEVIDRALQQARVTPETISYVEAHGTGTSLGDPIELAALNKIFRNSQSRCAIGSVKTNLGHLDAAAGISGLIKTILALHHRQIPPSLNFQSPNPEIDFANSPFYVNTKLAEWSVENIPRRAGVSSFGMGGTNVHVVLEEAGKRGSPKEVATYEERGTQLLVVSAKTETALKKATDNLVSYLQEHSDLDLAAVAYTLQVGRKAFSYRRMVVAATREEAIAKLTTSGIIQHQAEIERPITMMFSGQGSQYVGMAGGLYQNEPVFRENCDRCCQILEQYLDIPLKNIIFSPASSAQINQTQFAQPAIFTIEYALSQLWISWGIKPTNAIGHSIGEYVAATLAGVFSLEDALRIVAKRGQLMQQCPTGAMLSVAMSADDARSMIKDSPDLSLAVVNAPELCVISGTEKAISLLATKLLQQGIACRRLRTSHGFHSAMMEGILGEFAAEFNLGTNGSSLLHQPQLPFISNLTGTWITDAEATDPQYWVKHIRQTVNFSAGIQTILATGNSILLEIGGGRTLATLAQQHPASSTTTCLTSLPHPQEEIAAPEFMLDTLGQLWLAGVKIDWNSYYGDQHPGRIPLPTYPFERQRYWVERTSQPPSHSLTNSSSPTAIASSVKSTKSSKNPELKKWFYLPSWQRCQPLVEREIELAEKYKCLVFSRYDLFSQELKAKLKELGCDVTTVATESQFSQQNANAYKLNPHRYEDYVTLIDDLASEQKLPQKIIYLWTLSDVEIFNRDSVREFNSLVYLAQALTARQLNQPVQLAIITSNAHEVTGIENLDPNRAMIMGACKVIPQEFPQIIAHNLDLEINNLSQPNVLSSIVADVLTLPSENAIAYRRNYKWQQIIAPLSLTQQKSLPIKEEGTYLIAGDLVDGLGLMYIQYLAKEYRAKLVLIGREGLPAQADWQQWLESNQNSPASNLIQQLHNLSESGTEIIFIAAHLAAYLTDETAIASCFAETRERFGRIDGVIYAGTMGDSYACPLQSLTSATIDRQLQTKIHELVVLDRLFADTKLDFLLLQSSLSSIVGGVGFTAYTAANIFMDTFASLKNAEGKTPWFSINWDGYSQATDKAKTGLNLVDLAIEPAEAWAITKIILSNNMPQVIVSPTDLQSRIDKWIKPKSLVEIDKLQAQISLNALSNQKKPRVTAEYLAPRNQIERVVVKAMEELLGISQIGVDDNFFELGGHSLLAIQIVSRLRDEFQVDVPMREFLFESPTAAKIAGVIHHNLTANNDTDVDAIEQLLTTVENMSEAEIQTMLDN
ncbi:MAG: beta-ketoacyl synthase N-terminal-like domain-containing protein [Cyanobacteria bacterium J06623_7]